MVTEVTPGSIADELGVVPGDILLAVNGEPIIDVFDYRLRINEEYLTLTFLLHDGDTQTVEIEKDEDEPLGMSFFEPLMDKGMSCCNNCIFCFIAQLPKNMRETLYYKDDDVRLSFLTGNYVTLTNLSDKEFERMLSYHLSPINVSVHSTNPELRKKLLNNRFAGNILERIKRASDAGLDINCQFVLCPGINDGEELERSIRDLSTIGERIKSIAVVPVGLTKFRDENGLYKVERYDKSTAGAVLDIVEKWQKVFLNERSTRLFYAADEFYLRAQRSLPEASEYEDYPQLENGVGILSDFMATNDEFLSSREAKHCDQIDIDDKDRPWVLEISGTDAVSFHASFKERINALYSIDYEVVPVVNKFFGETITVTGLLTGGDIVSTLLPLFEKKGKKPELIILSSCSLKADEDIFLDDMTLDEFKKKLGCDVFVKRAPESFFEKADEIYLNTDRRRKKA